LDIAGISQLVSNTAALATVEGAMAALQLIG
jgi:hypothetical protein